MKEIIKELSNVAENETEKITETRKAYVDDHHAYAILKEEYEEAEDELKAIEVIGKGLWYACKADNKQAFEESVKEIKRHALRGSAELIQVVAVCNKYLNNSYKNEVE